MMRRFWAMLMMSIGVYCCLWISQISPTYSLGQQLETASVATAQGDTSSPPLPQFQSPSIDVGSTDVGSTDVGSTASGGPTGDGHLDNPPAASPPLPDPVAAAAAIAAAAQQQAQVARSATDWDQVRAAWLIAIAHLQGIPVQAPERVYAQRQMVTYMRSLMAAQTRAAQLSQPTVFPALGSSTLDQQLMGYLSYVAAVGVPDVLILGSSRALWGIDAQALEQALAQNGYAHLRVYNLGFNGATAQGVNFVVEQLLAEDQLPRLILWAGGSRALNSARRDATFASIARSPGYQSLQQGDRPSFALPNTGQLLGNATAIVALDANGFLAQENRFNPDIYYQQFPRVPGRFDDTYVPFQLAGVQTDALQQLAALTRSLNLPLLLINLPLTDDYLDETRGPIEAQFQQFLAQQSQLTGFGLLDYLTQWTTRYDYFADPSHLNRYGAAALARQLAADYRVPWGILTRSP